MFTWILFSGLTKTRVGIKMHSLYYRSLEYGFNIFNVYLFKTALLQKRVDEIARLGEIRKKEHERSFRLVRIASNIFSM